MIQLRIHDDAPDLAVYAQHRQPRSARGPRSTRSPATRTARWSTSRAARTPRTSSPASTRPRPGTTSPTASATRRAARSRSSPTTSRRGSPGRASGATRARGSGGIDQPSPQGPSAHASWTNPDSLLATAVGARAQGRDRGPRGGHHPRPRAHAHRLRLHPRQTGPPAASLQVTVNSRDEAGVPPRTYTFRSPDPARHAEHRRSRSTRPSTTTSTRARRAAPADPVGLGAHRARPGGRGREGAARRAGARRLRPPRRPYPRPAPASAVNADGAYEGLVSLASRGAKLEPDDDVLHCQSPSPSPLVDRNRLGRLQPLSPERCETWL